jgi:Nuclear pore protein 84 / 107
MGSSTSRLTVRFHLLSPPILFKNPTFQRARKTEPPALPSAQELLAENPYTPTSTLAQAIMNASPLLTELIVVREWLQETAPAPQRPEATTGYWKFTKYNVMQSLRSGTGTRDGLVKEMDPDALNREAGRSLAIDDMVSCIDSVGHTTLYSFSVSRGTIKAWCRRCTATSVQADLRTLLTCVRWLINLGAQRASADHDYSHGVQSVRFSFSLFANPD